MRERLTEMMTKDELDQLRHNLSRLSPSHVLDFYRGAYKDCAPEKKPGAKAMQQLVTAWRLLHQWRWR